MEAGVEDKSNATSLKAANLSFVSLIDTGLISLSHPDLSVNEDLCQCI